MYHSLAVTETGALYASGANDEGQIFADRVRGSGAPLPPGLRRALHRTTVPKLTECPCVRVSPQDTISVLAPVHMENLSAQRVLQVAGGMAHSACLLASQTVVTFGQNEFGQLGHSADKMLRVAPRIMKGLGPTKVRPLPHAPPPLLPLSLRLRRAAVHDLRER